ncbi:hypothetical protein ABZ770_04145 [Streptomyces sp. NPDC006654]|uniref:hypothetical protein n=1 Tax=Streptomyces sp. NPDC006654 TaxID=3156897 RepID=UPI00340D94D0
MPVEVIVAGQVVVPGLLVLRVRGGRLVRVRDSPRSGRGVVAEKSGAAMSSVAPGGRTVELVTQEGP